MNICICKYLKIEFFLRKGFHFFSEQLRNPDMHCNMPYGASGDSFKKNKPRENKPMSNKP